MAVDRESPLARWSRLKRTGDADVRGERGAATPENEPKEPAPAAAPPETGETAEPAVDLPDPETLGKDGDFSAYLREGVPEALKRRALRALWRSDPVLANLDGLNDYDEDYRAVGTVVQAVQTAWRAGRGYMEEDEIDAEAEALDDESGGGELAAAGTAVEKEETEVPTSHSTATGLPNEDAKNS